ncbi:MAG: FAD:protein FMN transferase [Salinivirgaceae bacterium]|nr:FAD:protein FMN transferase [Salinivirgaceae bacterium]
MKKLIFAIAALFFAACSSPIASYYTSDGFIQGTSYHIVYKSKTDLSATILYQLHRFDTSLSAYIPESTISRVNNNLITETDDTLFLNCVRRALEISEITGGAMDITVSPLVNAWGFGFSKKERVSQQLIDSLKQFCGYQKLKIEGNCIVKSDPRVQLNANCLAQGQSVDFIAEMFEHMGISDYMVEIGGEVRASGLNSSGNVWRIGIDRPIDDTTATLNRELQGIVALENKSLSTSGNYHKFFVENGVKYSHTINPATGYPVQSNLLSASIAGPDCITTDALATACMVVGVEAAAAMCDTLPEIDYYFIYSDSTGEFKTVISKGFEAMILK